MRLKIFSEVFELLLSQYISYSTRRQILNDFLKFMDLRTIYCLEKSNIRLYPLCKFELSRRDAIARKRVNGSRKFLLRL